MIQFQCDYNEGAHPLILERLIQTNLEQTEGYGKDHYCDAARKIIRDACGRADADIHFLVGGTQTNATVISSVLKPYQGVVCAHTGHINVHETGAIEHGGHKVLAIPSENGKLDANNLLKCIQEHYSDDGPEHMVPPGMIYISFSTETGTIYTKEELRAIRNICSEYDIPLFIDGARLGYGLVSEGCDMTLKDLADIADVFYIGGTKCGALCGEALVFTKNNMPEHFTTLIKSHLALGAKGRLTGVQFDALFTDDLYFRIGRRAIDTAMRMKEIMKEKGFRLYLDSPTNQQFFIIENSKVPELYSKVACGFMDKYDDEHSIIRLCTSWATDMRSVEALRDVI